MKHACPTCRGAGISGLAKRWSARENPATCELCGGLSHVLASTSSGICVAGVLILIAAMIVAAGMQWPLLPAAAGGVVLSIAFNIWAWKQAEMMPIPKDSADAAKAVGWFLAGFYALMALFG